MQDNKISKLLLINKPIEWTSFDVVKKIRNSIKKKYGINKLKVGHAGTLDPLATGLLIICTGNKTKTIQNFTNLDKTYIGTLKLGAVTDSFDRETREKNIKPYNSITLGNISKSFSHFIGEVEQVPPVFSAIKMQGEPLYKKARRGELNIAIKKRKIIIYKFKVLSVELPFVKFQVKCSKGTYIRTLVHDVGYKLGCGAYLHELCRTSIGKYQLDQAINVVGLEDFL
tara:strand:- start:319 stop:999 length:681 start_codon:yes stop_codon:yes gene_type:complete